MATFRVRDEADRFLRAFRGRTFCGWGRSNCERPQYLGPEPRRLSSFGELYRLTDAIENAADLLNLCHQPSVLLAAFAGRLAG